MAFTNWLRNLRSSLAPAGGGRNQRRRSLRVAPHRPHVEALEDRCLLSFSPAMSYLVGQTPRAVLTADFNGDGRLDIAVANQDSHTVSVLLGNAGGTFQPALNSTSDSGPGSGPGSVAVGDFNTDGKPDLATANGYTVSVLLGSGDGTFQAPIRLGAGGNPVAVAVGDFNADGTLDLGVTANFDTPGYWVGDPYDGGSYYPGYSTGVATVLLGNGDGSFSAPRNTVLGYGYHRSAAVADFNGDTILDFASADGEYGTVSVVLGTGTGTFGLPSHCSASPYPFSVTAGDLNGDGKSDLVTVNPNGNNVGVLLGTGTGSFGAPRSFATGSNPVSILLGDFDNNTTLDIATANYWSNDVSVLRGLGNGAFLPPVPSASGSGPWGLAAGDFYGDGWLDVVTTLSVYNSNVNSNIAVLINDHSWPPLPPPSIRINDVTVTEGNTGTTSATFTVSLAYAHSQAITAHYETANATATAGSDYTAASGDVTFTAGQTSKTVTVLVTGDRAPEAAESFFVNLSAPTNATIGDGQGVGTILDDEPRISINDEAVTEGDTGTVNVTFTVTLSLAYDQAITAHYDTGTGTATAGSDYTAASGDVIFAAGQTSKSIAVAVIGDLFVEPTENFFVNLTTSDAFLGDGQGVGTILNDDSYGYEAHPSAFEAIDLVVGEPGVFTILDDVDDSCAGVDLGGNTFTFYGVAYTGADSLFVSSNGLITFGVGVADFTNTDLSSSPDAPAIAPLWDDWITYVDATDQVLGKFDDVDGNGTTDRLVIEWTVYHFSGSPSAVTFQAVLGLNAGGLADPILFNYPSLDTGDGDAEGSSATVGIKDRGEQGLNRLLVSADSTSPFVGTGQALRVAVEPQGPRLSISNAGVTEGSSGNTDAVFYVTLVNPPTGQTVTVDFATAAGSAAAGSDFVPTYGTLTFLPGETSKPITVQVKGDLLNEDTESFTVNLSNPANAFIDAGRGTATILDDDPLPTLAVNDVQVTEGNAGTTNAVFTVSLSAPSGRWVSVYYSTANGTATAGSDYQVQSGWLTFAPGQLSQAVTVLVNGDTLNEANETFSVNLGSPINATLADAQGVGTTLNDDPVPALAISDVTLNEGNSGTTSFVFTVSLSVASGQPVTVNYATADGTAAAGSDYVATSGTLTIPAGQSSRTITVLVNGDRLGEANETLVVNLSSPANAAISDGQGVGTIVDDEPRISISDVSNAEGKKGHTTLFVFTVTLTAAYDQPVTMSFRTVDGTAKTGDSDYVAKTGTLTFNPGETQKTITIEVKGDGKQEPDEVFYLDLFGNSSYALFAKNRGIGTILNDD